MDDLSNKTFNKKTNLEVVTQFLSGPGGELLVSVLKERFSVRSAYGEDNVNGILFNQGQLSVVQFIERIATDGRNKRAGK